MNLDEYLRTNKINKTAFAKKIGIKRQSLYRIMKTKICSEFLAGKIEKGTDGEVKASKLYKATPTDQVVELEKRVEKIEAQMGKLIKIVRSLVNNMDAPSGEKAPPPHRKGVS